MLQPKITNRWERKTKYFSKQLISFVNIAWVHKAMGKISWGHEQHMDNNPTQTQPALIPENPTLPSRRQCSAGTPPGWCPGWSAGWFGWSEIRSEWSTPAKAGSSVAYPHQPSSYTATLTEETEILLHMTSSDSDGSLSKDNLEKHFKYAGFGFLTAIKTWEKNKLSLAAVKWIQVRGKMGTSLVFLGQIIWYYFN